MSENVERNDRVDTVIEPVVCIWRAATTRLCKKVSSIY